MINSIQNKIPPRELARISNLEKKLSAAPEDKKQDIIKAIEELKQIRTLLRTI